ncbi:MAG: glyoxylate/hydroxypyruvate reductase A [Saprospiraceae bacterium]
MESVFLWLIATDRSLKANSHGLKNCQQLSIMSIVIICHERFAKNWAKSFKEKLPETDVHIYPDVPSPEAIQFAAVWKAPAGVLSEFPNLKAVQSLGAGVEHIFDFQKINKQTPVARIIDPQLSEDMWEYILMLVLNYLKNTPIYFQQQLKKEWKQWRYKTIKETTVSILGLGKIGGHVAGKFSQIGFNVQGWSNSEKNIKGVKSFFGKNGFNEILNTTDILINILPLTPDTTGILNKTNLSKLKKGAYLINVGRGGHLIDTDLLELIDAGHLSGAALDVFQEEPLPGNHPFWEHPKITVMPHVAGLTNPATAVSQIIENYERMKRGEELMNVVSRGKRY